MARHRTWFDHLSQTRAKPDHGTSVDRSALTKSSLGQPSVTRDSNRGLLSLVRRPRIRLGSMAIACAGLLLLMAYGFFREPGSLDHRLLTVIQGIPLASLQSTLKQLEQLTSLPSIVALCVMLGAAFALARRWSIAIAVILIPISVEALTIFLGEFVRHAGPGASDLGRALTDPVSASSPSSHSIGAVLLFGVLTAASLRARLPIVRVGVPMTMMILIGLIGTSDLWLGRSWPTDVVAGYTAGGVMLALLIAVMRQLAPATDGRPFRHALQGVRTQAIVEQERSSAWLGSTVTDWQQSGRISTEEATELRATLAAPAFQAVLPHLAVHIMLGIMLTFPVSSVARISYTLVNLSASTIRFLLHRIDRRHWQRDVGIHSPIVMLLTIPPIAGEFAYLASRPVRSNHLLLRAALDRSLLRLPGRLYERTGMRLVIARAAQSASVTDTTPLTIPLAERIDRITRMLVATAVALLAADLMTEVIDALLTPGTIIWTPVKRVLNLNAEASFGTWFAFAGLLICALLCVVIARVKTARNDRFTRHWWGLGIIATALSIDEQAQLRDPASAHSCVSGSPCTACSTTAGFRSRSCRSWCSLRCTSNSSPRCRGISPLSMRSRRSSTLEAKSAWKWSMACGPIASEPTISPTRS